ncbi:unnamed protein product [Adineta steineri]|uniref:G-protein coupled receptors family 1 profile domain-containing protein n=1 Tax=Adineta steineri TaxID=433720 RepID=A0A813SW56_9BILA|nr:unnamed protein product [Adineta steineri]CAF0803375.1 unnamed protein product [Adineta steineri]CAF3524320.1 unnamed protein product [Adineta steineri]CAF3987167.1 unnamed protein product [Adineta steineri]
MLVAMNFGLVSRIISAYQPDPQTVINAFCKARTYFGQSSVMSYRWMLTMACIDRYTSSTPNARIRKFANPRIACRVIFIIVVVWIIVPFHNWIFLNINGTACVWSSSAVATYNSALVVICGFIIPATVMITCAVLINNNLRHKRKRRRNNVSTSAASEANRLLRARDRQTLLMLYVEISCYIIFTSPWAIFTVYNALSLSVPNKTSDRIAIEGFLQFLTETTAYLYPTLSFYLYTLASRTFRQELVKVISAILNSRNQCCNRVGRVAPF